MVPPCDFFFRFSSIDEIKSASLKEVQTILKIEIQKLINLKKILKIENSCFIHIKHCILRHIIKALKKRFFLNYI